MLQDIAIEEFSHLEMVGKLIAQHTSKLDQTSLHDAPLFKIKGGGPHFLDSQGSCWTAAYIQEGGNVVRDLRAISQPKPERVRRTSHLSKRATTRAQKKPCITS